MNRKRHHPDNRRNRWFADPRLQCKLLARTILYWLYSVATIGALALVWIVFVRRPRNAAEWIDQLWLNCGPLAVGSLLILPLILLDCVRFSSRFAGPMVRFRRALHDIANGQPGEEITLREGDFWCEFARDLRKVSQRLQTSQGAVDAESNQTRADSLFDALEDTTDFVPVEAINEADSPADALSDIAPTKLDDIGGPVDVPAPLQTPSSPMVSASSLSAELRKSLGSSGPSATNIYG